MSQLGARPSESKKKKPKSVAVSSGRNKEKSKTAVTRPKPMDVSQGRALYRKYQECQYNSVTQGTWLDVTVIMVNEDGAIMIDMKENYWFDIEEQRVKFRAGAHRKLYKVGQAVQYNSITQGGWLDCKVTAVDPDGNVQIDIKEKYWMRAEEQEQKLRLPVRKGADELAWEAAKLLDRDYPDVDEAERKYRLALQQEDDNIKAMDGLAILLRDNRGDYAGAEVVYLEALEENPYEVKILSDYADLLLVMGRRKEAEEMSARLHKVKDKLRQMDAEKEAEDEEEDEAQ